MGIKQRIFKAFFGKEIKKEIQDSKKGSIGYIEGLTPSESLLMADNIVQKMKTDFKKESKQVIVHRTGPSTDEGILPDIDFEVFNQMFEQTSWIRAGIGVIKKAVTGRGFSIVPTRPNADPANGERLRDFFNNANPNDTFIEMLDDIARDVHVFGNAYLEIVFGPDGKPRELWTLDATTVRIKANDHGGILGFVQVPKFSSAKSSARINFTTKEVIHFKLGTKGSTLYGLSPLASLILPITVDKFAQIYNRAFFINGAKLRGAFIMKDATSEQVERNREYLQARAKNLDLAQSDLVLEGEIEFKQIGVNQKDMEFLELREFTRNEVLAVLGVPPGKISLIETASLGSGTGEHQTQTFYDETIIPFQLRIAEKINKHIIRRGFGITDWAFQFNKRSIDEMDQANIFNLYIQNGVFTPDEVRNLVVARMPELKKSLEINSEIIKGKVDFRQRIVDSTRTVIALENRFVKALEQVFRDTKELIASQLPSIVRERVDPVISKIEVPFDSEIKTLNDLEYHEMKVPEFVKGLEDLEAVLSLIDEGKMEEVISRFSLETAENGLRLAKKRSKLEGVEEISLELKESIQRNATDISKVVNTQIKDGVRESLVEGITANESVGQLTKRVEDKLDKIITIKSREAVDPKTGKVIRRATERSLSRANAAEVIARTETNRVYNKAVLDGFQQAGIREAQFVLSLDACPQCRDVSNSIPNTKFGKTFPVDQADGVIPVHPNCRCTWVEVIT